MSDYEDDNMNSEDAYPRQTAAADVLDDEEDEDVSPTNQSAHPAQDQEEEEEEEEEEPVSRRRYDDDEEEDDEEEEEEEEEEDEGAERGKKRAKVCESILCCCPNYDLAPSAVTSAQLSIVSSISRPTLTMQKKRMKMRRSMVEVCDRVKVGMSCLTFRRRLHCGPWRGGRG
jgi:hypothetical protein